MQSVKQKSVEHMEAVLSKHAGKEVRIPAQPPKAVRSPKAKSGVLEWHKPRLGVLWVKTRCERYCCCKVTVMGQTTYELWKFIPAAIWFRQLHIGLKSFQEAQRLASEDFNR